MVYLVYDKRFWKSLEYHGRKVATIMVETAI